MTQIILPELGEGVTKATVAHWHAKAGEHVTVGQDLVEVVTDKASFNIESPATGVLKGIQIPEGKDALVKGVLGTIE